MGSTAQDVLGPLVATHAEAPWLLGLLKALDDGTLDARIEVISELLRPTAPEPIGGFL